MPTSPRQMFLLPNTLWGRFVLWLLRRYVNRASYTVRVRGRGVHVRRLARHDRARWNAARVGYPYPVPASEAALRRRYWASVPIAGALRLGVYVDARCPSCSRPYHYGPVRPCMTCAGGGG